MKTVQPWMRLKVKADTLFVPTPDGGVYLRNNVSSFRMEGTSILAWIEQLLPAFDGQESMEDLTDGLPDNYRNRIYEIASILHTNGFLRDASADETHELSAPLLEAYATQIEFLDNLGGSGAHRFQSYRQSRILLVGSGTILHLTASALTESGLAHTHVIDATEQGIPESAQTMDAVLYVSDRGDLAGLRQVDTVCRDVLTPFLCAFSVGNTGFIVPAGRRLEPDTAVSFGSVWRRVHRSVLERDRSISGFTDVAAAVLANVLVFELFKAVTGVDQTAAPRLYVLDGETLEGKWHSVIPSLPKRSAKIVTDLRDRLMEEDGAASDMADALSRFAEATNPVTGIFHTWDEGKLLQIPLAQCRVVPIDPRSAGPADLLSEQVCARLTHDEARREAGLTGIEAYVRRLAFGGLDGDSEQTNTGVGAGYTLTEAVGRGLEQALTHELSRTIHASSCTVHRVQLTEVDDDLCQFCLRSLRAVGHDPEIWRGDDVLGFPVLWVEQGDSFVGSIALSASSALQQALLNLLLFESGEAETRSGMVVARSTSVVRTEEGGVELDVTLWERFTVEQVVCAIDTLAHHGAHLEVINLAIEPFLEDVVAGVVGVSISRGEAS